MDFTNVDYLLVDSSVDIHEPIVVHQPSVIDYQTPSPRPLTPLPPINFTSTLSPLRNVTNQQRFVQSQSPIKIPKRNMFSNTPQPPPKDDVCSPEVDNA